MSSSFEIFRHMYSIAEKKNISTTTGKFKSFRFQHSVFVNQGTFFFTYQLQKKRRNGNKKLFFLKVEHKGRSLLLCKILPA